MVNYKRKIVNDLLDVDCNRLYGKIDEAIEYLNEIAQKYRGTDIGLKEHWTGYEDMEMVFSLTREETDEEYSNRIGLEEAIQKDRDDEAAEKREAERRRDLAQFERLRKKLGK